MLTILNLISFTFGSVKRDTLSSRSLAFVFARSSAYVNLRLISPSTVLNGVSSTPPLKSAMVVINGTKFVLTRLMLITAVASEYCAPSYAFTRKASLTPLTFNPGRKVNVSYGARIAVAMGVAGAALNAATSCEPFFKVPFEILVMTNETQLLSASDTPSTVLSCSWDTEYAVFCFPLSDI